MTTTTLSASLSFHPGTPWGLFRFESPEVGVLAGEPAVAPVDSGTPDPEAGAVTADPSAAAPEAATPAWGPDTPEFQYAIDQAIAARVAQAQHQQQRYVDPYDQGGELLPPDPWDDDYGQKFAAYLEARDQRLIEAMQGAVAPIRQTFESQRVEQGTQESYETFKTFSDLGEFDHGEAFTRAQEIFTGFLQQYGPQYAEQFTGRALRQAAEAQAAIERKIEQRGVEAYKAQLAAAAGHGAGEPGVGGGAVRPTEPGHSYDEVIARWNARQAAPSVQV